MGVLLALAGTATGLVAGCASPLYDTPDRELRRTVRESAERELAEAAEYPTRQRLVRQSRVEALGISTEVMRELGRMAGPDSYQGSPLPLGPTLYGTDQAAATITLEHAVRTAVENNLNVEFARLAPAISQNQVVAAEAAFDWVLFSNSQWAKTHQPRSSTSIGGTSQVGVSEDLRNVADMTVGARKPLISGGQFTVQHQFVYSDVETENLTLEPDPARESNIVVQLDQPLLRNFGSDVNLAQVRLARNAERDEIQNLKGTLIQTVTETEAAYWDLVRARQDLLIIQRLLERGEDVARVLGNRQDADPANKSSANATVQARRADLLRAQNVLRRASRRLKVLMNDPRFPVGAETLLLPADEALDQPIEYSLIDMVNTAFANRPEVQRAIISLDNTSIRVQAAENALLPQLNLRALARINGLGGSTRGAYDSLTEADFVDYQIGLNFELPVGNEAAEAGLRGRRLERMQATTAHRNTLQGIVNELKEALDDTVTNYQLIEQTRASRIAAAEDVRTLLVQEERVPLTPDFLDLKLRRQQALAAAEQEEISALADYNTSLARLYASMGTSLERSRIRFEVPDITRPESLLSDIFPNYPYREPESDTWYDAPARQDQDRLTIPDPAAAPAGERPLYTRPAAGTPGAPEHRFERPRGLRRNPPKKPPVTEPAPQPEP